MIVKNKILTDQDVIMLNLQPGSGVILDNTIGQKPEIIEQISPNVKIQVLGGYNPQENKRFLDRKYAERVFYTPQTLADSIRVMENIEQKINHKASEMEKALFCFCEIVKMIKYDYNQKFENHNRNLECFTHKHSRCAGFAMCYKEMMDRLGIKNQFKNIGGIHSFNVLFVDNKKFIVDLTFGRNDFDENKEYLHNFGCFKNKDSIVHTVPNENVKYDQLKLKDVKDTYNKLFKQKEQTKSF